MERRIGVTLDSLGQPVREALQSASRLGFRKVEMPATSGPVDPAELSRTGRRDLLHFVGGLGVQLAALGGDLGGGRFAESSRAEERLDKTRAIVELAADLHVPLVTTHLGRIDDEVLRRGYLLEAVRQLADVSDRTGTFIAFETGGTEPARLADILRQVNAHNLGVCYDPASLLIDGYEPLGGIEPLANSILVARARDALAGSPLQPGREVPLGTGQVDTAEYLAQLDQAGYRGGPFIRRAHSPQPLEDLARAKDQLERLLNR